MTEPYKSNSHCKFLLQYHLVLVCKYRKKLLAAHEKIANDVKSLSMEICECHGVIIRCVEVDRDHIHYMIETAPNVRLSDFVRTLKSYTTYHLWQRHSQFLSAAFWGKRVFWSSGYFVCTIGNAGEKTIRKYIENQGKS